ncbi:hypothetical protein [Mesorhizobium helmanticense]|uniref:Uncharacterized protein n=1 Tax=Mesorhizobium helmanticense TaxID=1776423 RepID=A0A2T4IS53_9HYPH|nr:hypothetical protein [Mesorhizobium helmanticense]PTE08491.1 hypothetical protein C9427_21215 [Mesorhizobium helmanticense]
MQDDTSPDAFISALDLDILRNAFRSSVAEGLIGESHWIQHAKDLVRELTGRVDADETIISKIIGR